MDFDVLFYYGIPKEDIENLSKQFEELENIKLKNLSDDTRFEIFQLLFKRIQIFFKYREYFENKEKEEFDPSKKGVFTKKEIIELKESYKTNMRIMWKTFEAAALEGDWILRKIVGSKDKFNSYKDRILSNEKE